jgi:hypothetical protein
MKVQVYIDGNLMQEDEIIHYTISNYANFVDKYIDIQDAKKLLDSFGHLVEEYAPLPCVIGIDNGLTGGVTILSQHTGAIIAMTAIPVKNRRGKNEVDIYTLSQWLMKNLNGRLTSATYYVEEPCGSKSLGAALSMASSFHSIRGMLETKNLSWHGISARTWQNELLGKSKIKGKKTSEQAFAVENWPEDNFPTKNPKGKILNDGVIDACLIAEYGRRQYL